MESSQFIRAKLENRLTASCSDQEVKNNRYIYSLKFEKSVGWDWVYAQIKKAQRDLDREIELWKIRPSGVESFEIQVREVNQREGIDDNQRGLAEFE